MTIDTIITMLAALNDNDGLTLRKGKSIQYKTGYQVADYGESCTTLKRAAELVLQMHGSCGIWLEKGIYYIDHSFRVKTKREALAIGRAHNQISILKWSDMSLVYC